MKKLQLHFIKTISLFVLLCSFNISGNAQLTTSRAGNYGSMTYLVNHLLLGSGLTATNITYQGIDTSFGFFYGKTSNIGMDSGIVITNGTITLANGPNKKTNDKSNNTWTTYGYVNSSNQGGWPGSGTYQDADLANLIGTTTGNTYSCAVLQFDFVAISDSVSFQYVFGSNEEPCWVSSSFVDDFGFFLSGPGINGPGGVSGPYTNNAENLALIPGTNNAVYIKNVNCTTNSAYWVCNYPSSAAGCPGTCTTGCPSSTAVTTVGYNGFTTVLTAKAAVQCGKKYHIKLGVADISNGYYDSGVFLKAGSFKPNTNPLTVSAASTTCTASPVTLTANGGVSYTWSPSSSLNVTTGGSVIATPTVTTTYTVIGNMSGGCDDTAKIVVTVAPNPTLSVTPSSPAICSAGSVNLLASGASSYSWTPSAGLSCTNCPNPTATPTVTTKYYVTGTSGSGCTNKDSVTITVAATLSVTVTPSVSTICNGDSVLLNANGASTFIWSPSSGLSCPTCPSTYAKTSSTSTYTVVGSSGGCNAKDSITITVNPTPTITANASAAAVCAGGPTTLTAFGGATYTWSPSSGLSITAGSPITATPTVAITYVVTGTDGSGCSSKDSVKISINPTPTLILTTSVPPIICSTTSDSIKASGAIAYLWSPSSSLSASTGSAVNATPPSNTIYTVIGTSTLGCNDTAQVTIFVNPTPTLSITPKNAGICPGDSVLLVASGADIYNWNPNTGLDSLSVDSIMAKPATSTTYTVTGTSTGCSYTDTVIIHVGNLVVTANAVSSTLCFGDSTVITAGGAITYAWNPASGLSATSGASVIATPTVTTTYSVVGTSGSGCNADTTIIITVNPTPTLSLSAGSNMVCFGTGGTTITATGATGYSWSPASSLNCPTCPNPIANPGVTTTYTVTGTNPLGCSSTDTISIQVDKPSITAAAATPTICSGGTTSLDALGGVSYTWSPSSSLSASTGSVVNANPTSATTYTVIGIDALGCIDSANVPLTVNQTPSVTASTKDSSICSGNSATLNATGANTYSWNPSTGLTCPTCANTGASPASSTTYTLIGTSSAGCPDTTYLPITVNSSPNISIGLLPNNDTLCKGIPVTMTASGGTTYTWKPSTGLNNTTGATITATIQTSPIIYTVIGSNGTCSDSDKQTLYLYPPLTINMKPDSLCLGKTGTVNISVSGGKPGYSYVWNNNLSNSPGPFIVSPNNSTYYVCNVTDGCNYSQKDSMQVFVAPVPTAKFTATPENIWGGQFVSFVNTSSGATSYYWNLGGGASSVDSFPYYQYNIPGTYIIYLVASNQFGCIDSASDTITVVGGIVVPNVFTPNGDGQNDVFHITAGGMQTYTIEIFNRWGQKVFETNSPNIDWTGKSMSGVDESDGTYYYLIKATDYSNKAYNLKGYLELIR